MAYGVAYLSSLLLFALIDILWLTLAGAALYRATLGDVLVSDIRIPPAVAFYLIYPIGLVAFAVMPAVRNESIVWALGYGLLFGFIAYATYDLTNYATLRNWTFSITVIDLVYGAVASAAVAAASYSIVRAVVD